MHSNEACTETMRPTTASERQPTATTPHQVASSHERRPTSGCQTESWPLSTVLAQPPTALRARRMLRTPPTGDVQQRIAIRQRHIATGHKRRLISASRLVTKGPLTASTRLQAAMTQRLIATSRKRRLTSASQLEVRALLAVSVRRLTGITRRLVATGHKPRPTSALRWTNTSPPTVSAPLPIAI